MPAWLPGAWAPGVWGDNTWEGMGEEEGGDASDLADRRQGAFNGRSSPIPRNRLNGTLTARPMRQS